MPVTKYITKRSKRSRTEVQAEAKTCRVLPPALDGPPPWHYACRKCRHRFVMPVPKGPTEERSRTCPRCHSKDIKRTDDPGYKACPPGG